MKIDGYSSVSNPVFDINGKADTLVDNLGAFEYICSWILKSDPRGAWVDALKGAYKQTKIFRHIGMAVDLTSSVQKLATTLESPGKYSHRIIEAGSLVFANGLNVVLWLSSKGLFALTFFGKDLTSLGSKTLSAIFLPNDLLKLGRAALSLKASPSDAVKWLKVARATGQVGISLFYTAAAFNPNVVIGKSALFLGLQTTNSIMGLAKRYLLTSPKGAQDDSLGLPKYSENAISFAGG